MHERRRELNALLIAVRERLHARALAVAKAEPVQPGAGGRSGLLVPCTVQDREVLELIGEPHLRVQTALLGHVSDALTSPRVDSRAAPRDAPGLGRQQTADHPHGRRLPRTVAADKAEQASRRDRETQIINRDELAKGTPQPAQLKARSFHVTSVRLPATADIRAHAQPVR